MSPRPEFGFSVTPGPVVNATSIGLHPDVEVMREALRRAFDVR